MGMCLGVVGVIRLSISPFEIGTIGVLGLEQGWGCWYWYWDLHCPINRMDTCSLFLCVAYSKVYGYCLWWLLMI